MLLIAQLVTSDTKDLMFVFDAKAEGADKQDRDAAKDTILQAQKNV